MTRDSRLLYYLGGSYRGEFWSATICDDAICSVLCWMCVRISFVAEKAARATRMENLGEQHLFSQQQSATGKGWRYCTGIFLEYFVGQTRICKAIPSAIWESGNIWYVLEAETHPVHLYSRSGKIEQKPFKRHITGGTCSTPLTNERLETLLKNWYINPWILSLSILDHLSYVNSTSYNSPAQGCTR